MILDTFNALIFDAKLNSDQTVNKYKDNYTILALLFLFRCFARLVFKNYLRAPLISDRYTHLGLR